MTDLLGSSLISAMLLASVLAEPPRLLEYQTIELNSTNGEDGGTLAILDGEPRVVTSVEAWTEWTLRETDKGWTIKGLISEEKPGPRYLFVDKEGKVKLVAEPGEGAYWKLSRKDKNNQATLQASGGKFDGWYLGFSNKAKQFKGGEIKRYTMPTALRGHGIYWRMPLRAVAMAPINSTLKFH